MLREMATSYGRSPGGYLWAVLEPIAGVLILTFAFGLILTKPPVGSSFALFYATGVLPFTVFVTIANKIGNALIFSKPLLFFPAVTVADAIFARFILNVLTELLIVYVVFIIVLLLADERVTLDFLNITKSLTLTVLFALGVGTSNAFLFLRFPIWHVFWGLINRPLFIVSGVFFIYDKIPDMLQDWLWFNPLIHVVGIMRSGFYTTYDDYYTSVTYVLAISLVLIFFGFLMLFAFGRRLIQEG